MIYHAIGKRIQQAREERGLTQDELAAKLGCTQSALSNYELGKRRIYLSGLEQIARVLDKPLSYFIESPSAGPAEHDVARLLEEPQLKELLLAAAELPPEERKLALDFIKWRRGQK